jgi:chromosome segregation protein
LLAHVRNAGPAAELLARVRTAASLEDALVLRSRLAAGESVITPQGVWLSRNWVRVSRKDAESGGVLTREREMRDLQQDIGRLERTVEQLGAQRDKLKGLIGELEEARRALQAEQTDAAKKHAAATTELSSSRNELERLRQRSLALGEDSQSIEADISHVETSIREAEARLAQAQESLAQLAGQENELQEQQRELTEEIEANRRKADADREQYQSVTIEVQAQRSSRASATTTLERALAQRKQLTERIETLTASLSEGQTPMEDLKAKLQSQLALKVTVDAELRGKHEELESANNGLRTQESRRADQDKIVSTVRDLVDSTRMAVRELEIRREAVQERFNATGLELETVQNELPEDYSAETWLERQEKLQRSLDRIGTVNLLAIEEFEEQSERATYLEAQYEDLSTALETLEKAIRKIDRETRARFQEVFEKVNAGLKRIFPRLFGGGHAYMSLEGDDLLNAGVTVMAQPPGKRNSSIHLLSGGEKALTAVALVFSIFELNPAPFCLLDEVDAPLDDANVGRFCDIVREMSGTVQFLFITHNKVTMELASQLMGVTMGEPGVSRLVSVDIDEAVKLAG